MKPCFDLREQSIYVFETGDVERVRRHRHGSTLRQELCALFRAISGAAGDDHLCSKIRQSRRGLEAQTTGTARYEGDEPMHVEQFWDSGPEIVGVGIARHAIGLTPIFRRNRANWMRR